MYRKSQRNMVFGILALLVAITSISFAYAGFSQTLNITGSGKVVSSKWDIHFENLSEPDIKGSARVITAPTITSATTIGTYSVQLLAPGDSVSYTFDVVNDGNFNATLTTLTKNNPSCTTGFNCSNLTYSLVYTDGDTIVSNDDTLNAGETKTMKLTLSFNASNNSSVLATTDSTVSNLGITLLYSQEGLYTVAPSSGSTLALGDTVTYGDESFTVISLDDGEGNVLLLADKNIDTSTLRQSDSANTLAFSGNSYWSSLESAYNYNKDQYIKLSVNINNFVAVPGPRPQAEPGNCYSSSLISPYNANEAHFCDDTSQISNNTNCAYVYDSNSNLSTYVNNYVIYLKTQGLSSSATGRIISLEEAYSIAEYDENGGLYNCIYPSQDWSSSGFWLGSVRGCVSVWGIYRGSFGYYGYTSGSNIFGLRPVIVVPVSDL